MHFLSAIALASFSVVYSARAAVTVKEITSFATGAWLENIAIRANGNLLLTRTDVPEIWTLSPTDKGTNPQLVASIPGKTGLWGIIEVAHDIFAVVSGNLTTTDAGKAPVAGSFGIWTVDLRKTTPTPVLKASVSSALFLDGLTKVNATTVLTSDALGGQVYAVNLVTGTSSVLLSGTPYEAPDPTTNPICVNGVRYDRDTEVLYFTNSGAGTLGEVHLDGTSETTVSSGIETPDDFALAPLSIGANIAFTSAVLASAVERVDLVTGARSTVASGDLFAGITGLAFGRTRADATTAYVVTAPRDVSGTMTGPAKVVAVSGLD